MLFALGKLAQAYIDVSRPKSSCAKQFQTEKTFHTLGAA
jgi:hypothetical protein